MTRFRADGDMRIQASEVNRTRPRKRPPEPERPCIVCGRPTRDRLCGDPVCRHPCNPWLNDD